MRCQYCGKRLPLFRKLTDGEFCSPAHRKLFFDQQEQLALGRLIENGRKLDGPRGRAKHETKSNQAVPSNDRAPVITETVIPPAWDRLLGDRPPGIPFSELVELTPVPLDPPTELLMPEPDRSLLSLRQTLQIDRYVDVTTEFSDQQLSLAEPSSEPLPLPSQLPALTTVDGPGIGSLDWRHQADSLRGLWPAEFVSSRGWSASLAAWESHWRNVELPALAPDLNARFGDLSVDLIVIEPELEARRMVETLFALAGVDHRPADELESLTLEPVWQSRTLDEIGYEDAGLVIEPFEYARGPLGPESNRPFEAQFGLGWVIAVRESISTNEPKIGDPANASVMALRPQSESVVERRWISRMALSPLHWEGKAAAIETTLEAAVEPAATAVAMSGALPLPARGAGLGETELAGLSFEAKSRRMIDSVALPEIKPFRTRRRILGARPTPKQVEGITPPLVVRMKRPFRDQDIPATAASDAGRMVDALFGKSTTKPRVSLAVRGGGPRLHKTMQGLPYLIRPLDGLELTARAAGWATVLAPAMPRLTRSTIPPGPRRRGEGPGMAAKIGSTGATVWTKLWAHAPADIRWVTMIIPLVLFLAWYSFTPKGKVITQQGAQASVPVPAVDTSAFSRAVKNFEQRISARAAVELSDDFRSGLANWAGEGNWSDNWSYDQGGFIRPGTLALYRPSTNLTDYKFEFLGKIEKRSMSWVYRAQDVKNYYASKLTVLRNGPVPQVALVRYTVVNGKETNRKQVLVPINSLRQDTIYRVRVDVNGNDFTTSVLGQVVDTYSDTTHARGGIGFFTARGDESRLRWVELSHQYDTIGRLCALIVPYGLASAETKTP